MADNPVFEAGTARLPIGTTIAADDVGGALVQRVKPVFGTDGNATDVSATNPLPVTGTVTLSAGVTVASLTVTVKNAITLTATSRLFSITGTVSVVVLSLPEITLTGSFVNHAANAIDVNIVGGAGSGGTASTDDAAFTVGVGSGTPAMGYAGADTVDVGDVGVLRMTAARGLHSHLVDSLGSSVKILAGNGVGVGTNDIRLLVAATFDNASASAATLSAGGLTADLFNGTGQQAIVVVQITGTWVGDVFFEGSVNGTDFSPVDALPSTGDVYASETTANGLWSINTSGLKALQARASLSSGQPIVDFTNVQGGNVRSPVGGGSSGGVVSLSDSYSVAISVMPAVSLTVTSRLISITGTVSVQITSQPEQTLTGSYVDGASNALRISATAASRLISLTGTISVNITTMPPVSITGSYVTTNNALRVEGTLTFLAETRYASPTTSKLSRANFQFSTTASSTIVAGVGGQTIRLMKILFTTETQTTWQFESSTSAISATMILPANGALVLDLDGEPWYITSTADPLRLHSNSPASIGGTVWYTQS